MKVTREQAAENRERIVDAAAKLFRERGFDGVGVADIMKSAGLTHGGFYGHFESKDALAAEACARALDKSAQRWDALAEQSKDPLGEILESYLSPRHRDRPGDGCAIAALGADAGRQNRSVRRAVTDGVRNLVDRLGGLLPGRSRQAKRQAAIAGFAAMVGAVVLARAMDDPDLSEEVLRTVGQSLKSQLH